MDYEVMVQESDKFYLAHCSVYHFSPSVWKDMKLTADALKEVYKDKPLYAPCLNTKLHDKFLTHLGFRWLGDIIPTENDEMMNVWRMV